MQREGKNRKKSHPPFPDHTRTLQGNIRNHIMCTRKKQTLDSLVKSLKLLSFSNSPNYGVYWCGYGSLIMEADTTEKGVHVLHNGSLGYE